MKTNGNRAAEDCSNSVGNLSSNLVRADKAQPSLCVHMEVAGAQNRTSVMFVMRKYFY